MAQLRSPLIVSASSLALSLSLSAVEIADLAGDWNLAQMDCPSRLREIFVDSTVEPALVRTGENSSAFATGNEVLTDAFYPDPYVTEIRSFNISGSGAVTGGETGQILNISGNRLFYSDGAEETTLFSNIAGDLMLTSSRTEDLQDQTLCLKRPASLTEADLAGDWKVVSMINPADISTTQSEGRLSDTFFVAEASNFAADITIDVLGEVSGAFAGGVVAGVTPGDVTITIEGQPIPFKCNASKNLMVAVPGDANEQEMVVMIRKPSSLVTADLAGTWRISAIIQPTSLTEGFYNTETEGGRNADSSGTAQANEILVDVFHRDPPELNRLMALVDNTGAFTGSVTGSMTASGSDTANVVLIDGDAFPLYISADKTFMVGVRSYFNDPGDVELMTSHELIYMVKVCDTCAPNFEGEVDFQPVNDGDRIIYSWNNGSNLSLQSSSTLGGWSDVDGAGGADTLAVTPSGTQFFQVTETTEE